MKKLTSASSHTPDMYERERFLNERGSEDLTLIHKPIHSSLTGFLEAHYAFLNSTNEVRHLLLHECNFIYECKVCQNLFRSFQNFVNHKQLLCRTAIANILNNFSDKTPNSILKFNDRMSKQRRRSTGNSGDLRSEELSNEQNISDQINHINDTVLSLVTQLSNNLKVPQVQSKKEFICKPKNDKIPCSIENCKELFNRVDNLKTNNSIENNRELIQKNNIESSQITSVCVLCKICDLEFESETLLNLHIKKKHISSTFVYQCPICLVAFYQISSVERHLKSEHKTPYKNICKMRASIRKRRIKVGSNTRGDNLSIEEGNNNMENAKKDNICKHCKNGFENETILTTHLIDCGVKFIKKEIEEESFLPSTTNGRIDEFEMMPTLNTNDVMVEDKINSMTLLNNIMELHESESDVKDCKIKTKVLTQFPAEIVDNKEQKIRIGPQVSMTKDMSCFCKLCGKQFTALSNLRRHLSMFHYRAGKFGCTLCDYRAFRRYDIFKHLNFVHKITGERDELSKEYVAVNEVLYTKSDADGDIVIINENESEAVSAMKAVAKCNDKASKGKKTLLSTTTFVDAPSESDSKSNHQKLKRSNTAMSVSNGCTSAKLAKRPMRNRIKIENKDYLYDLSKLSVGKEQTEHGRLLRRQLAGGGAFLENVINEKTKKLIKGSAQRICSEMVQRGCAKSSTSPELPSERPQMRQRGVSTFRKESMNVSVIDSSDLEAARLKTTVLDDNFLVKNCKTDFKMKPFPAGEHSALSSLLQKVDQCLHPNVPVDNKDGNGNIVTVPVSPKVGPPNLAYFISPEPSIPITSSTTFIKKNLIDFSGFLDNGQSMRTDHLLRTALEN